MEVRGIGLVVERYICSMLRTCHSRRSSVGERVVNAVIEGGGNPAVMLITYTIIYEK